MTKRWKCLLMAICLLIGMMPVSAEAPVNLDILMQEIETEEALNGEGAKRFSETLALLSRGSELYTDEALTQAFGTLKTDTRAYVLQRILAEKAEDDVLLIALPVNGAAEVLWTKAGDSLPLTPDEGSEAGVGTQIPGTGLWLTDAAVEFAVPAEPDSAEPVSTELMEQLMEETEAIEPDDKASVKISVQPQALTASVGDTVKLSVTATGVKSYQWQYSYNGGSSWTNCASGGYNTKTYTYTVLEKHYDRLLRCELTGTDGLVVVTDEVPLYAAFSIQTQPQDQMADVGESASFTVVATGVKAYLWQYSYDSGKTWVNCASGGHNTKTYTFTVLEKHYGRLLRCRLTDAEDAYVYTDAAALHPLFAITAQPQTQSANVGDQVSVTVEAAGVKAYLWQYSYNNGTSWTNCASGGYNTKTYTWTVLEKHYGRVLRCRLTTRDGAYAYTDTVGLNPLFAITAQPQTQSANVGDQVSVTVEAVGVKAYLWQYSYNNGTSWTNCASGGYNTKTYTWTVLEKHYGRVLRCRLTTQDGAYAYTDTVGLNPLFAITAQPQTQSANVGDQVSVTVEAMGVKAYLWQYSYDNGKTWKNCASGGYNTKTYTWTVTAQHFNRLLRCRLTAQDGAYAYTDSVGLIQPFAITTQPTDKTASVGDVISFTVTATGVKAYLWQYSTNSGTTWSNCASGGYNTKTYTMTVKEKHYTTLVRCRLTGQDGAYLYTDSVHIWQPVIITGQPQTQIASVGDQVSVTVEATGAKAYLWQYSYNNGTSWSNCASGGYNTRTYTWTVLDKHYGRVLRCRLEAADGSYVYSDICSLMSVPEFEFAISGNDAILVRYNGTASSVTIPSAWQGMAVTVLGENCFAGMSFITSIAIPYTVRDIRDGVFDGCTSLTQLSCY